MLSQSQRSLLGLALDLHYYNPKIDMYQQVAAQQMALMTSPVPSSHSPSFFFSVVNKFVSLCILSPLLPSGLDSVFPLSSRLSLFEYAFHFAPRAVSPDRPLR